MTLASAISALTPVLYWKLDEATNSTTVLDSAGGAFNGSVNDGSGLGVFGPEIGRTALRVFTGTRIVSPNWGASTWSAFSVMFMATAPANAAPATSTPFLGLGDVTNPSTKFHINQQSSTANTVAMQAWSVSSDLLNIQPQQPVQTWHHYCFVFNGGTGGYHWLVDGVPGTNSGTSITPAPVATDKWWIDTTAPIVVSDMAVFTRALTNTEVQSVSNQIQAWPYQVPINVPLSTGINEPVTISPTDPLTTQILANTQTMLPQTAQIPAIDTRTQSIQTTTNQIQTTTNAVHTDTQNIITTLFPQLETPLNYIQSTVTDILNGITTTIGSGVGAVAQTLGDFFAQHSHDELGVFNVTGGPTCSRIDWTAGLAAYWGLTVNITSYPSEWTFTTPDDGWSIRDLAVLTIFIGDEQQVRLGIHTRTFSLTPLPSTLPVAVAGVGVKVTPSNYRITVDWAGGVCGELLLQYLP